MVWTLLQIVVNIVLALGILVLWLRLKRPPKDDPRLSRGLQLLQSKISVLEDLSDRTDVQVKQLTTLLDQKARQLQNKVHEGERQIQKIDQAMERSMEVAEIFQDKIPHKEIIERQNTINYVRAARMAHEGYSVDEIEEQVNLPREQLEFIAKVNRDRLMFDAEMLPAWAQKELERADLDFSMQGEDLLEFGSAITSEEDGDEGVMSSSSALLNHFEEGPRDYQSLQKLGDEFRQACAAYDQEHEEEELPKFAAKKLELDLDLNQSRLVNMAKKMTNRLMDSAGDFLQENEELAGTSEEDQKSVTMSAREEEVVEGNKVESQAADEVAKTTTVDKQVESSSQPLSKKSGSKTSQALKAAAQKASSLKTAAQGLGSVRRGQGKQAFIPSKNVGDREVRDVEFPRIEINDNLR